MAIIGQQLLQPEAGWKRYDEQYPLLTYLRTVKVYSSPGEFGGSSSWIEITNEFAADRGKPVVTFKAIGESIRLMGYGYSGRASDGKITINGEVFPLAFPTTTSATQHSCFCDLVLNANGINTITISGGENGGYANFCLDSIDIKNGYILHPDEVTNIKELVPGKRIRCHYQATANSVGLFSNLGKEVYKDGINDFIPVTSSATPNGCFYFICVGYDENGKIKLVADRNIQHSISWDKINEAGFIYGKDVYFANIKNTIVRSLSGGKSSVDKNNEWYKIIAESSLNNNITPADNTVWNWRPIASWTATAGTSAMANRIKMGGTALTTCVEEDLLTAVSNTGFRPVLLLDDCSKSINILIKNNDKYYTVKDSILIEADKQYKKGYALVSNIFSSCKKINNNCIKNGFSFKNKINKKLNKKINIK